METKEFVDSCTKSLNTMASLGRKSGVLDLFSYIYDVDIGDEAKQKLLAKFNKFVQEKF